jgi:tetratricopeptide (TPR) repeat protein
MQKQRKPPSCSKPRIRFWIIAGAGAAATAAVALLWNSQPSTLNPQPSTATPAEQERALRAEQLDAAQKLVAAFPNSDDATYLLGLVHNEQGDSAAAIKQWQRSLELDASRADANDSLGYAFLLRDEYDEAEKYFRKALALDPALATANFRLANTLVHQGNLPEAVAILEKANSLSAEGHRLLGEAYQQMKEHAKARASYEAAIKANPNLEQAYYGLSKVLAQLGDEAKGQEYWAKFTALKEQKDREARTLRAEYDSLAITKRSVAQTHTDVGRVYIINNRPKEAEALWLQAASLDASNTLCRLQLAIHYQQTAQYPDALRYYREVAGLDPTDALVQLNIGRVCLKLNQSQAAEKAFEKVVQLAPNRPEGHAALAQVRAMRNQ